MEDKRNIIVAILLSALILFGWPFIAERFFPSATPPAKTATANAANAGPATPPPPAAPGTVPTLAETAATNRSIAAALAAAPRVLIETGTIKGSINLKGARIDDLVLVRYKETLAQNSQPVRLFAPGGTSKAYFAGTGWNGDGLGAPDANTLWQAPAGAKLTPATPVTITHDNGRGQLFSITYSVDANYMFTVRQTVTNRGAAPVNVGQFAFISRNGTSPDADTWTIHSGVMGVFNNAAAYINTDDINEAANRAIANSTTGGWVGFTDHFWLGAIIPAQNVPVSSTIRHGAGEQYQADFSTANVVLPAGRARTTQTQIFAGAKETSLLDDYTAGGITLLDRATDWGWFIWFAKPIFYVLDWLFRQIGNFGFAIIALTVLIRALMFPIAQKQFASMAAMRVVQPKVKALQERYADDKPRLQQEMMQLYKTEKINPLAGCLPIMIQIPVFYALYKCLMLTVEMRHQPFLLWIKDLSAPDPLHILNLFGLLPFTPPSFLSIGILAVMLGGAMALQFKLNPPPADPVQGQVMAIMPWMLMFVMAPFAAGLLLYQITSTLLSILQQWGLYTRYPEMKQAAGK
ncbi:MAG: membrane protein insertase YidC [Sphingopyxis sp.]